jgi:hypothetical protein
LELAQGASEVFAEVCNLQTAEFWEYFGQKVSRGYQCDGLTNVVEAIEGGFW